MELSAIYQPIRSQLLAFERQLVSELAGKDLIRASLMGEMTRHVARMTGKRVRPALAFLGADIVADANRKAGKKIPTGWQDDVVKLATSVEMIHTATLLHDDVIDGATLRRNLTTLNAKWGDTLSVLSGDYLYSKAFCLLSELPSPSVLHRMSDTARLVCEGEVSQIQHQYDFNLNRESYLRIIEWKTASLMGAAAECGAWLAGASAADAKRLGVYGTSFGMAFQILDDLQDLVGDQEIQGKSLGTDLALGQMTLPLLYLRDSAPAAVKMQLTDWFNGNGSRTYSEALDQQKYLKKEALRAKVPAYCKKTANQYLAQARKALSPFPPSSYKKSLLALTDFLLQ